MASRVDFLTPNAHQIRHQVRNIIESYNHDWDLLAELTQNAVDAITIASPVKGHIHVSIDAIARSIVVQDNGCGIDPNELPSLLAPFSSAKLERPDLIGQKGVGLSFVIFSSASFEVKSHHASGSARAKIEGAWAWVEAKSEDLPELEFERVQAGEGIGTTITVRLPIEKDYDFFQLSFRQLDMILRTRTALGDTRVIWGAKPNKDFLLTFRSLDGQTRKEEIDCRYLLPTEALGETQFISLRDFQDWNTGEKTDAQKRQKLRDKLIFMEGQRQKAGRSIRFWACFVPKRRVWDTISAKSKLVDDEILDLGPVERIDAYGEAEYLFSGGMFTCTRGMPTGIRSDMRAKGSAGYLPNFFIILDDPQLSFDIGRKAIASRQLGMLRDVASDVFRDFINGIKKYIGGEPDLVDEEWDRSGVFNAIRDLPDLENSNTCFIKRPAGQEATVAAIFFELLGGGVIKDIRPYISGYKNKYDLYAKLKTSDVVIEFKYHLSSLFRDFDDEVKLFDQIDIVVVWDIVDQDYEVVKSRGLDLQEVEPGLTKTTEPFFHFSLTLGPTRPIRICCLSRLLSADKPAGRLIG